MSTLLQCPLLCFCYTLLLFHSYHRQVVNCVCSVCSYAHQLISSSIILNSNLKKTRTVVDKDMSSLSHNSSQEFFFIHFSLDLLTCKWSAVGQFSLTTKMSYLISVLLNIDILSKNPKGPGLSDGIYWPVFQPANHTKIKSYEAFLLLSYKHYHQQITRCIFVWKNKQL